MANCLLVNKQRYTVMAVNLAYKSSLGRTAFVTCGETSEGKNVQWNKLIKTGEAWVFEKYCSAKNSQTVKDLYMLSGVLMPVILIMCSKKLLDQTATSNLQLIESTYLILLLRSCIFITSKLIANYNELHTWYIHEITQVREDRKFE
jgi:hypothetical protein